jgi:hypothetical protein
MLLKAICRMMQCLPTVRMPAACMGMQGGDAGGVRYAWACMAVTPEACSMHVHAWR